MTVQLLSEQHLATMTLAALAALALYVLGNAHWGRDRNPVVIAFAGIAMLTYYAILALGLWGLITWLLA